MATRELLTSPPEGAVMRSFLCFQSPKTIFRETAFKKLKKKSCIISTVYELRRRRVASVCLQVSPLLERTAAVRLLNRHAVGVALLWCVNKFYAQFMLGYGLLGFCLFTFDRYWQVQTAHENILLVLQVYYGLVQCSS